MAEKIEGWKNSLEKNRYKILYVAAMFVLFLALAGWALLPDEVLLIAENAGGTLMDKNTALVANLALNGFMGALFWFRPREIVYFVGLCMAMLMATIPLLNMMVG